MWTARGRGQAGGEGRWRLLRVGAGWREAVPTGDAVGLADLMSSVSLVGLVGLVRRASTAVEEAARDEWAQGHAWRTADAAADSE